MDASQAEIELALKELRRRRELSRIRNKERYYNDPSYKSYLQHKAKEYYQNKKATKVVSH